MLVLSRKEGESITVIGKDGEQWVITITKTSDRRASLGIEAGKDFRIVRTELLTTSDAA